VRRLVPLLVAIGASGLVAAAYAALGGASYDPTPVADPCAPRAAPAPEGVSQTIEHVALKALDNAACELGVGREELVLALRSEGAFDALAAAHGIDESVAERTVKEGLVEAIDDAEGDGELPGLVARLARGAIERVPPWLLLESIERIGNLLG
jgi:hypothetical protein